MKTKSIKVLPNVNNIDWAGRIYGKPAYNRTGTVISFDVIRNFGGNKKPLSLHFVMFKPKEGFPAWLENGTPVTVHAYYTTNTYTDKDGNEKVDIERVVKTIEKAELLEKTIEVSEDDPENPSIEDESAES